MTGNRQVCTDNGKGGQDCHGYVGGTNTRDDLSFSKVGFADPPCTSGPLPQHPRYPVGLGALLSVYLPIDRWANSDGTTSSCRRTTSPLHPQIILDKEWGRSRRFRTALNVGALVRFGTTTFTDLASPTSPTKRRTASATPLRQHEQPV